MPANPPSKPISLRAYARHRGVSHEAVRRAIETRRLDASVVMVKGEPKVRDPELADREWHERTRPRIDHVPVPVAPARPPRLDDDEVDYELSYEEARRRREVELWLQTRAKREQDELDLAERRGELVAAAEVSDAYLEVVTAVKSKLLAVPSRARQRLPHLTAGDVAEVEELVREALEDLAGKGLLVAPGAADGD